MENRRRLESIQETSQVDPFAETQPAFPKNDLSDYQPIRVTPGPAVIPSTRKGKVRSRWGCILLLPLVFVLILLAAYLFIPARTNVILLGIDDRSPGAAVGRSDTMILVTFQPVRRYLGMLSIPRDLWVQVPGYGENRINTAHFFAEAQQSGSGPQAVKNAIGVNFNVAVQYFVRIRFDNFLAIIDAMGGVVIDLPEPISGYPAGSHSMNSEQALAFIRDRSGADDFSRMRKAQILLRSLAINTISPGNIQHWPEMARIGFSALETDIPVYLWPKLGFNLLVVGVDGIDSRIITREMVQPFVTNQGAQVLEPRWELIQPMILEMFGR
jgi:polyisoprenyl-teichoic acid--peptidoglycan teichoic acid transferase